VGVLQVTDADTFVQVRMLVSASNAPDLFDLRCNVREGMVAWLQRTHPGALPRARVEHQSDLDREIHRHFGDTGRPQAGSSLFSGTPEAERRGRAFDDSESDGAGRADREPARVRYDGD
jgi:hypothetical protein